jgi:hypothetical protein
LDRSLDSFPQCRDGVRIDDVFAIYGDLIVFADVDVEEDGLLEWDLRRSDAVVRRLCV